MAFEKIKFAMKTWKDAVSGNTPITAAELNRIEKGISDTAKGVNDLGDSVSPLSYQNQCEVQFICNGNQFGIQIVDKITGNCGFITIKKDSQICANVRIDGTWVSERLL